MHRVVGTATRVAGITLALAGLAACQSLPDIAPWDKATRDVALAVGEGFQASASVNEELARRLAEQGQKNPALAEYASRYRNVSQTLESRREEYDKMFGAIADYSASLAAISKASANSEKTVSAVASSLNALVDTVGVLPLAGPAFELGKTIAGELVKVQASRDFGDAVRRADPVIGRVAELAVRDLDDLRKTVAVKEEPLRAAFEDPMRGQLDYRSALLRRRAQLYAAVRDLPGGSAIPDQPELARVEQYLRATETWYAPLQRELAKALADAARAERLIVETRRGLEAWRASHASLAAAATGQRAPDTARLVAISLRIRGILDEMRKEK